MNQPSAMQKPATATPLGDLKAETDHVMLDRGFVEVPDYRTLLEANESKVVVGRRGTGKSALTYQLSKHWHSDKNLIVFKIAPDEDEVIGIRPIVSTFADTFRHVRVVARLLWKYALILELASLLASRYKSNVIVKQSPVLQKHLDRWRTMGHTLLQRVRSVGREVLKGSTSPEDAVGDLATRLQIREIQAELLKVLEATPYRCLILIDKLDEGYEPDAIGIGLVNGIIYAISELDAASSRIRAVLFMRDNIFRAMARDDPDFSRNIEGMTLRLHWDSYQLFQLVCNRLRLAFGLDIENNQRLWDRCTANELQHQDGFRRCLQLTLYRPRDILLLLNQAFNNAGRHQRQQIILTDVEATAKSISSSRLADLRKEYESILPGLSTLTAAFAKRNPELSVADAEGIVVGVIRRADLPPIIQQEFVVLDSASDHLSSLYSVGFIGIEDSDRDSFVFCHDGKQPDREFTPDARLLIHPCYWLALNLSRSTLNPEEAENINDEYEIQIASETPEIRNRKLGQMMAALDQIPQGDEGAARFEEWCCNSVGALFAGNLRNVELHPNSVATQRRDIVANNPAERGVWKRIYDDYQARQVIFEVKNYSELGIAEYRQMLSYLCDDYGKLGFIITRDIDNNLRKGADLAHFLEMYHKHRVVIVRISALFLRNLLSKIRRVSRHDEPDSQLQKLLDQYSRSYMSGQAVAAEKAKIQKRRHMKSC